MCGAILDAAEPLRPRLLGGVDILCLVCVLVLSGVVECFESGGLRSIDSYRGMTSLLC